MHKIAKKQKRLQANAINFLYKVKAHGSTERGVRSTGFCHTHIRAADALEPPRQVLRCPR